MDYTNSTRFVFCYNRVDEILHSITGLGEGKPFSMCLHEAAKVNATVKRFQEELASWARLRNAIVHSAVEDKVIAEPHDEVVSEFERVLRLLEHPPKVVDVIEGKPVVCVNIGDGLERVIKLVSVHNYSNVPVLDNGAIVGLITPKDVVRAMGEQMSKDASVDAFLKRNAVRNVSRTAQYRIAGADACVQDVITMFANPKLRAVILTEDGMRTGRVVAIVTSGDLLALNDAIRNDQKIF